MSENPTNLQIENELEHEHHHHHRRHHRHRHSRLTGCLSTLLTVILTLLLTALFFFFGLTRYLEQFKQPMEEPKIIAPAETQGKDRLGIEVSRESFNQVLANLFKSQNEQGVHLSWEGDKILIKSQVEEGGYTIPLELSCDLEAGSEGQLYIVMKEVHAANLPLPMNQAYALLSSQVTLPEFMVYNTSKPQIQIDLNALDLPLVQDEFEITADQLDLSSGKLVFGLHFEPELIHQMIGE